MARRRDEREQPRWPPVFAEFDPQRHGSRASWHLERAGAAKLYFSPHQAIALDEIRASLGRPSGSGGVVFVYAPRKDALRGP
jgi:hypothetical protein